MAIIDENITPSKYFEHHLGLNKSTIGSLSKYTTKRQSEMICSKDSLPAL